MEAADLS